MVGWPPRLELSQSSHLTGFPYQKENFKEYYTYLTTCFPNAVFVHFQIECMREHFITILLNQIFSLLYSPTNHGHHAHICF